MSQAHGLVAQIAIVLGLSAVAWSITLLVTRRASGPLFLGNLVSVFLVVVVAAVLGVAILLSGTPPRDGLHVVYGALALGVLPGAALIAAGRTAREQSIVVATGAIVLLILIARLFQTGS